MGYNVTIIFIFVVIATVPALSAIKRASVYGCSWNMHTLYLQIIVNSQCPKDVLELVDILNRGKEIIIMTERPRAFLSYSKKFIPSILVSSIL